MEVLKFCQLNIVSEGLCLQNGEELMKLMDVGRLYLSQLLYGKNVRNCKGAIFKVRRLHLEPNNEAIANGEVFPY